MASRLDAAAEGVQKVADSQSDALKALEARVAELGAQVRTRGAVMMFFRLCFTMLSTTDCVLPCSRQFTHLFGLFP